MIIDVRWMRLGIEGELGDKLSGVSVATTCGSRRFRLSGRKLMASRLSAAFEAVRWSPTGLLGIGC